MNDSAETTGLPDVHYDLVSTLYHQVHAARTFKKYAEDANRFGDPELWATFQRLSEQARLEADHMRILLKARL